MTIPDRIERQIQEIMDGPDITLEAAREQYPEVISWFNEHIDLADLIRQSGVDLRPISPDRPDILVGACPRCRESMLVRT